MQKEELHRRQIQCLDFYYSQCRRKFFTVRAGHVLSHGREFSLNTTTAKQIIALAQNRFNPLWALRLISEESIQTNRDPAGKLATITYKRAGEYAAYGKNWAILQRDIAESSFHTLQTRLPSKMVAYNISAVSALDVLKQGTELDPVVELAFCRHCEVDVDDNLLDWAIACYAFYPAIYQKLSPAFRKANHLSKLYRVPDEYTVLDRPADISSVFSTEPGSL